MSKFKLGVLGGIGPEATAYFYAELTHRLQQSGQIRENTDFPQIIVNSIPAPELTHLQESADKIQPYIEGVKVLASFDPDLVVMVCNTIHLYLPQIKAGAVFDRILSIREVVEQALLQVRGKKVCVLGTPLTMHSGLYSFDGIENIHLNPEETQILSEAIEVYNRSGDLKHGLEQIMEVAKKKQADGADVFLLACTEISNILRGSSLPKLDTLDLLIAEVVRLSLP